MLGDARRECAGSASFCLGSASEPNLALTRRKSPYLSPYKAMVQHTEKALRQCENINNNHLLQL